MSKTETAKEKAKYLKGDNATLQITPPVESPAEPQQVKLVDHTPVRFTYVPPEGLFCGTAKEWEPKSIESISWFIVRRNPRLAQWLTQNPLSIVYGRAKLDGTFLVTSLYAGGQFIPELEARRMTPHLKWLD